MADEDTRECERCGGSGVLLITYRTAMLFGLLPIGETTKEEWCPDCGGTGVDQ
jgi:DnaJ-class molecular chaperone